MRRNLFTIAATIVVALLCVAPAAAQTDSLFLARRASMDSANARVLDFLEADSTVQSVPSTRRQPRLAPTASWGKSRLLETVSKKSVGKVE